MNMLQIQDALKNASDQQLAMEMQNPTGVAPQFLVLSELKRRRDMRASTQAQQAPQGTVADELIQQNDGGIRDIVAPDEPEAQADDEMAAGGLVGLRRMREGGVVRMAEGGLLSGLPRPMLQAMLDGGMPIPQGMTRLDVMNALSGRQASMETTGPGGVGVAEPPAPAGGSTAGDITGAARNAFQSIGPVNPEDHVSVPRNPGRAPLSALPPLRDIETQAAEAELEQRPVRARQEVTTNVPGMGASQGRLPMVRPPSTPQTSPLEQAYLELERMRRAVPFLERDSALIDNTAQQYGVSADSLRERLASRPEPRSTTSSGGEGASASPPNPAPPAEIGIVNFDQDGLPIPGGRGASVTPPASANPPPGSTNPPGTGRVTGLPGATVAARTGTGGGGAPAAPQEPAQTALPSRTDDRLQQIYDRLERDRVDPAARRNDAINMGLIEAGLRIAGSQSPHLASAISEGGVPALQGYTREMAQVRQDQRQDNRDQLQTLLAQNQQEYYRGRITLGEMEMRNRMAIAQMQENRADIRAAMAAGRANEGRITPRQYLDADDATRAVYDRYLGRDSADLRAAGTAYTVLQNRERRVRESIDSGLLSPADLATRRTELGDIQRQMQAVESRLMGGGGGTLTRRDDGSYVYQPGGR